MLKFSKEEIVVQSNVIGYSISDLPVHKITASILNLVPSVNITLFVPNLCTCGFRTIFLDKSTLSFISPLWDRITYKNGDYIVIFRFLRVRFSIISILILEEIISSTTCTRVIFFLQFKLFMSVVDSNRI